MLVFCFSICCYNVCQYTILRFYYLTFQIFFMMLYLDDAKQLIPNYIEYSKNIILLIINNCANI